MGIFDQINDLLNKIDLNEIDSESNNSYDELPDGYYLSQVEKAQLTESKSSGQPMVSFQFKVEENGYNLNDEGTALIQLDKTKNRKIFVYYVLKDEKSIKKFISDMLKFEGDEEGNPLLDKDYFTNADLIQDALDVLIGMNIYIQISTNEYNGQKSSWKNLISWKRAKSLELPV